MNLEQEIQTIKDRNRNVEMDKAWETSAVRRFFIAVVTYVIAFVWLLMIHDTTPFLKAFVPAAGYILSTLSLPVLKKWWLTKNQKHA